MSERDEGGQVTLLIIGFASILLMAIVVVIDASAAYLQRQGLDNLADGAALYGADLGSTDVYASGVEERGLLGSGPAPTAPDLPRAVALTRRVGMLSLATAVGYRVVVSRLATRPSRRPLRRR